TRCSPLDIEGFKSGKLPLRAPNKSYANTLIKGLVEGEQFSEPEAIAYIDAAAKSL
ncbi:histone deacetylase 5-like, partial [Trifolium medium]|nr:histone deacetylase 5-like [Trifolium medium]